MISICDHKRVLIPQARKLFNPSLKPMAENVVSTENLATAILLRMVDKSARADAPSPVRFMHAPTGAIAKAGAAAMAYTITLIILLLCSFVNMYALIPLVALVVFAAQVRKYLLPNAFDVLRLYRWAIGAEVEASAFTNSDIDMLIYFKATDKHRTMEIVCHYHALTGKAKFLHINKWLFSNSPRALGILEDLMSCDMAELHKEIYSHTESVAVTNGTIPSYIKRFL